MAQSRLPWGVLFATLSLNAGACAGRPLSDPEPLKTIEAPPEAPSLPASDDRWVRRLPALSEDGQLIAYAEAVEDGARGNENLALVILELKRNRILKRFVVIDPAEPDEPGLAARHQYAAMLLDEFSWQPFSNYKVALAEFTNGYDGERRGPDRAEGEGLVVEYAEPSLAIRDADGRQLFSRDMHTFSKPGLIHCRGCPLCPPPPARLGSVHGLRRSELLLVTVSYGGTDLCWEPNTSYHLVRFGHSHEGEGERAPRKTKPTTHVEPQPAEPATFAGSSWGTRWPERLPALSEDGRLIAFSEYRRHQSGHVLFLIISDVKTGRPVKQFAVEETAQEDPRQRAQKHTEANRLLDERHWIPLVGYTSQAGGWVDSEPGEFFATGEGLIVDYQQPVLRVLDERGRVLLERNVPPAAKRDPSAAPCPESGPFFLSAHGLRARGLLLATFEHVLPGTCSLEARRHVVTFARPGSN